MNVRFYITPFLLYKFLRVLRLRIITSCIFEQINCFSKNIRIASKVYLDFEFRYINHIVSATPFRPNTYKSINKIHIPSSYIYVNQFQRKLADLCANLKPLHELSFFRRIYSMLVSQLIQMEKQKCEKREKKKRSWAVQS